MSIEELEQQLRLAQERARNNSGTNQERLAAFEAVSEAQRNLAAARGLPFARPLDIGILPEAGASEARLIQDEYRAALTLSAIRLQPDGHRADAGTATVEFVRCMITKFGYPNDEALGGHPLYNSGLSAYGVFEVIGSPWIRRLTEQNRVAFPATSDSTQRHFIFTFHDSTFECIADDLRVSIQPQSDAL
jgi:hypothetical protein